MKKLILLPVLMLALAACTPGTSSEVSSSSEAASSSESSEVSSEESSSSVSSSTFVADTRVWSIVGSFGTSNWANTGTDYDLTRVSEFVDQFEITLDLFVGEEFAIIHDRAWNGQLGFSTINSMTPEACMIEGGGFDVKNAQTAVAGNYHIVLDTTNHYVPHIAVTRLGDPLVVPTEEFWRLAGSFNAWTNPDDAYLLAETATAGTYEITLDLYIDDNFKVVKNGASWFGFDKLGTITPEGCMTDNGGNINVTVHGSYVIQVVSGDAIVVNVTRVGDPIVPPPSEVFWRLFGSFNSWLNPDDNFLMVETETAGTYEFTLDLYVGNEFKAVKNETIYVGGGALGTVEPLACVGGTDNIVVAVDGSYKVSVVDAETDVINVTRMGDPIVPPVGEVDGGAWYLTGTINAWDIADATTYALVAVDGQEHTYAATFTFAVDAEFVVNAGGTWDLKRGPSKVALEPTPIGIDVSGDNIKVTEAGSYKVTFVWATALGGSIIIDNLGYWNGTTFPEGYMSIAAILAEATATKVYTTRSTVVGINGGSIFLEDADGSAINVYNSGTSIIKDSLLIGNVVDAVGAFKIYNNAAELDVASLTLVAQKKATPIAPVVIADSAALTARMGTNYSLSGQLVRLNGVTVGPVGTPSSNNYVITFGTTTVIGYSYYSAAYETATTGRTAINAAIAGLNTSAATFNVIGVLYCSSATGVWKLGITTVAFVNVI